MLDPLPLKGRTAVVTGSGQNIGEAIAKLFSQAGANVVVNGASSREKVERVVAEIRETGGEAIGVMADVGDADAVEAMVDEAAETFGSVDIAVSNVSIRKKQPVEDISVKDWQDTIPKQNSLKCIEKECKDPFDEIPEVRARARRDWVRSACASSRAQSAIGPRLRS